MDNSLLSAIIGLAGALVGAIIAGWVTHYAAKKQIEALKQATELQIQQQIQHSKEVTSQNISVTKTSYFMERYSNPSFMEIRDEVELFLAKIAELSPPEKIDECLALCRKDTLERVRTFNRIHALGMFFGEIGVSFEYDHIDCDGLAIFDRIIPYYWKVLDPFVRACHIHYGFILDEQKDLSDQDLVMFTKFRFAYNEMVQNGLAKEPSQLRIA